jgi:hypothetical protein
MADLSVIELITNHAEVLKTNLGCFFQIIGDVKGFIRSRRFDTQQELIDASIFVIFISLVNLAIRATFLVSNNVQVRNELYLILDTITTYLIWLLCGIAFHMSARLLRGKGTLRETLVTWMYLQAFDPVFLIAFLPADARMMPLMIRAKDSPLAEYQSIANSQFLYSARVMGSTIIAFVVFAWFLFSLVRAFGLVHGFGRVRAILVLILGFGATLLIEAVEGIAVEQMLWAIK